MFDLTDKVAIVTGAAAGIGQAMAVGLAEAGADIVGVDINAMDQTAEHTKNTGRKFVPVVQNLAQTDEIPSIVQKTMDEFGKINILVNCAGITDKGFEPQNLTWEEYINVQNINLNSMVRLSLEVYKVFVKQGTGGKIINMSSIIANLSEAGSTAYGTSKAAIIGLTKAMAVAGAKHNIWVNALAPAAVMTPMFMKMYKVENLDAPFLPSNRRLLPENLKGLTIFLASEESNFVTGQLIYIDGGMEAVNLFENFQEKYWDYVQL